MKAKIPLCFVCNMHNFNVFFTTHTSLSKNAYKRESRELHFSHSG